ncbi:hypothetical protein ERJ75_001574600 [Trypanosoma vivax]|nr:hypothetical protein ERJ75_001574600 [Trypanosoma vivax]
MRAEAKFKQQHFASASDTSTIGELVFKSKVVVASWIGTEEEIKSSSQVALKISLEAATFSNMRFSDGRKERFRDLSNTIDTIIPWFSELSDLSGKVLVSGGNATLVLSELAEVGERVAQEEEQNRKDAEKELQSRVDELGSDLCREVKEVTGMKQQLGGWLRNLSAVRKMAAGAHKFHSENTYKYEHMQNVCQVVGSCKEAQA